MAVNRVATNCRVGDQSGIGEARRAANTIAAAAGFNETDAGKLAIAVTEAAANVLRHGNGGEILLRPVGAGIEMLAIDKGPGIANLENALRDGQSTAGTAGIGLGAISRLASVFDVYTGNGLGTALAAQFYPSGNGRQPDVTAKPGLEIGVAQSSYPGEVCCGDAWAWAANSLLVADGLGHGFPAAEAAAAAVEAFEGNWHRPVRDGVEAIHLALRPTRGAAVAIAQAEPNLHTVYFCGLGNISAFIVDGKSSRGMMSHNGTAGHEVYRIAQMEYAWPKDALLVLHTDGISAKWDLGAYPGLALRHPSLIAAVLYRDFRRQRDDATIVVARSRPRQAAEEGA
jgi:anti-sigma regulatory factor (Ser/Thr protein kinase)